MKGISKLARNGQWFIVKYKFDEIYESNVFFKMNISDYIY